MGCPQSVITSAKKVEALAVDGQYISVSEWKNQRLEEAATDEERDYINSVEYIAIKRESQVPWRLWDISALAYYQDEEVISCRYSDPNDSDSPLLVGYKGKNFIEKSEFCQKLQSAPEEIDPELAKNNFAIERFKHILHLRDLDLDSQRWHSGEVFLQQIESLFGVYNKMGLAENGRQFDSSSPKDVSEFFLNALPKYMGSYMAKFHKLGLMHGYPHFGNWTAAGTLIDLDSVTETNGLPVTNRTELIEQYRLLDVKRIMYEYKQMFDSYIAPADQLLYNLELNKSFRDKTHIDNTAPDANDLLKHYQQSLTAQGVGIVPERPELMDGFSSPWKNILYQLSAEADTEEGILTFRSAQDAFLQRYLDTLSTLDPKFNKADFLTKVKEDQTYRGYL